MKGGVPKRLRTSRGTCSCLSSSDTAHHYPMMLKQRTRRGKETNSKLKAVIPDFVSFKTRKKIVTFYGIFNSYETQILRDTDNRKQKKILEDKIRI